MVQIVMVEMKLHVKGLKLRLAAFAFLIGLVANTSFGQIIGYNYKKAITIHSSQVVGAANHANFPMLFSVVDNDLRDGANGGNVQNSSGFDVIFTQADGVTQINHQLNSYDPTTGSYVAWVQIPSLDFDDDMQIYMYYSNTSIAADQSTTATWDANYQGVWHLEEIPNADCIDATANTNDGTPKNNPVQATGLFGNALDFNTGNKRFVEIPADPTLDLTGATPWTMSAWVKPTSPTADWDKWPTAYSYGKWRASMGLSEDQSTVGVIENWINDAIPLNGSSVAPINDWTYLAVTSDADSTRVYFNGDWQASRVRTNVTNTNEKSYIGSPNDKNGDFHGIIDEVRLSKSKRSSDWIATEYNNQQDPSTFYTVGPETGTDRYSVTTGNWNQPSTWSYVSGGAPGASEPEATTYAVVEDVDVVSLTADANVRNLLLRTGGEIQYANPGVDLYINDQGGLTLEDGTLINGNGQNNSVLHLAGATNMLVDVQGTGNRINDITRINVTNSDTVTFQGSGDINLNLNLRLNGSNVNINNMTGLLNIDRLQFTSNNVTFINNGPVACNTLRLNWANGTLVNNNTITVTTNMQCNGAGDVNDVTNNGTLTVGADINLQDATWTVHNYGTFTHSGNYLNIGGAELFHNYAGATWSSSATDHTGLAFNCDDPTNTFIYERAGNQNIFVPADGEYQNLIVRGTGTKTADASLVVFADFTLDGSATMEMATNSADMTLHGNYTNNATYNAGATTVQFVGSTPQTISGTSATTLFNLTVNNTSTGLTLAQALNVGGNLNLTDGFLTTDPANLLTILDNGTASSGSSISFVDGPMKKVGDDAFVFPVGDSAIWARIEISAPAAITDEFTAEYVNGIPVDYNNLQDTLHNVSTNEYWDLDRTAGSSSVVVKLYFEDGTASGINLMPDLMLAHYTGSDWEGLGTGITTGTIAAGTVSSNGPVSSFSPFTFGSGGAGANPLPVELLSFNAEPVNNEVRLTWETATEINFRQYHVQKMNSDDQFETIAQIEGRGNSNSFMKYDLTDFEAVDGANYYRLIMEDNDGTIQYSEVKAAVISSSNKQTAVSIYPNPSPGGQFSIEIEGYFGENTDISVFNASGAEVQRKSIVLGYGLYNLNFDLGRDNPPGIYFVNTRNGSMNDMQTIIVEE